MIWLVYWEVNIAQYIGFHLSISHDVGFKMKCQTMTLTDKKKFLRETLVWGGGLFIGNTEYTLV